MKYGKYKKIQNKYKRFYISRYNLEKDQKYKNTNIFALAADQLAHYNSSNYCFA